MGGRPSREINPDPGSCPASSSDIDKSYHVSDHWYREAGLIERELERWLNFRWWQFKEREDSKVFDEYKEIIHKYQEKKGWAVELQLGRQTKLDEWREYYIYEYRKRPPLEKNLEWAKKKLESRKEEVRKAERNGSVGVDWSSRGGELDRYNDKISHTQKEVDLAQKRLNVLNVEKSLSDIEKTIMITQAKKDLESAHRRLEFQKSGDFEQLNKEVERTRAQARLGEQQKKVDGANKCLKELDTLLEWIAEQVTEIATEHASSGWESQHNRDLLDGWERYYVYMRERLQAAQDDVARRVQEEAEGRMPKHERGLFERDKCGVERKEEQFETLWAWIRREFPEIAAKYAPSSHDSQSDVDHQSADQATLPYVRRSARRKGRSARKQSPLSQVQPSKVSKSIQGRRRPINERLNATRHAVWQPEGANDVGQVKEQRQAKAAVRRSKQVPQRACDPAPALVRAREKSSRYCPDVTVRQSARILERTEKLHSIGSVQEAKPAQLNTTARRKLTRHTVHTDTAYSGAPQGISKTRRWKATPKKRKNV